MKERFEHIKCPHGFWTCEACGVIEGRTTVQAPFYNARARCWAYELIAHHAALLLPEVSEHAKRAGWEEEDKAEALGILRALYDKAKSAAKRAR